MRDGDVLIFAFRLMAYTFELSQALRGLWNATREPESEIPAHVIADAGDVLARYDAWLADCEEMIVHDFTR